jgi:site-specific recombinase XerD
VVGDGFDWGWAENVNRPLPLPQTAWRIVKRVMRHCGINGRQAFPRGLRHGFGIGTLHAGVPLNLTQRWMGQAGTSTTAIYAEASGPEEIAFAARYWQQYSSTERIAQSISSSDTLFGSAH